MQRLIAHTLVFVGLIGCDAPAQSSTPSDVEAAALQPEAAASSAEPTRTNPEPKGVRSNPPAARPASYAEGMAALDLSNKDALGEAVSLFIEFHPAESTRASTLRQDLDGFLEAAAEIAQAVAAEGREDSELQVAACERAGFDCGKPTDAGRARIVALEALGFRYAYAGEGTTALAVNHPAVAAQLDTALDAHGRLYLAALHAGALLGEGYDEGGFERDPQLAVDALLAWEALADDAGPYAALAPKQAADVREQYLRLCFNGEQQTPGCQVSKPLRSSYAAFAKEHADSVSAKPVSVLSAGLRRRKWRATAEQLDALVSKALATMAP